MASSSKKSLKSSAQFLPSISRNSIPPRIWFAILSIPQQASPFTEILLSSLDYLQIIIQALLANSSFYNNPKTTPKLFETLLTLGKTMNPGSFQTITANDRGMGFGILAFLTFYAILKYGFLTYIITHCFKRSYPSKYILEIWRWVFRLQRTVVYFLVTSIWTNYFRAGWKNTLKLEPGYSVALMLFAAAIFFIEFTFSLISILLYSYSIPNKSVLSAKNQWIEATSVFQKFIIQVFKNVFLNKTKVLVLFSNIFSFVLCMLRNTYYFKYFPHYKLKGALHHATWLTAITCLYLAYLVHYIVKYNYDSKLDPAFGLFLWVILMVPLITLMREYVKNVWSNLIIKGENVNKDMVIHRAIAMKQIIKQGTAPTMSTDNHSHYYLLSNTIIVTIKRFLGIENECGNSAENPQEFNIKENLKKYMIKYLPQLLIKYPKNKLIKLYIASYYAQKLTIYGPALKLLQELKNSSHFKTALTAHMMMYSLQENLKNDYKYKRTKLDLATYIEDVSRLSKLKGEIFKQAGFQVNLYENMVKSPQDLGQIFKLAQKVDRKRKLIEKMIHYLMEVIPQNYLEPLVIFAHYYSVLNNAPHQSSIYTNLYSKRNSKYQKLFQSKNICQENIFHKDTQLIISSLNKKDGGMVKYMSKGLLNVFEKNIVDYHLWTVSEGSLKETHYQWANYLLEQANKSAYDVLVHSFQYNFREECFMPCDFYHHVSPYLSQGLFLFILLRFSTSNEEFLIIEDSGDIIGFTKFIGQKLGLFEARKKLLTGAKMNINQLSMELTRANHAMNMVNSSGKVVENSLDDKEAKDLHSLYTETGEDLALNFLGKSAVKNKQYTYRCRFQMRFYGTGMMRVVALQRVLNNDASISLDESEVECWSKSEEKNESEDDYVPSENVPKKVSYDKTNDDIQEVNLLTTKRYSSTNNQDLKALTNNLTTIDQDNMSTSRKLLISPRNFSETVSPKKPTILERYTSLKAKEKDLIRTQVLHKREPDVQTSTRTDRNKGPNQLSKDFQNAVSSKYYSNFSRVLRFILYITIILIFAFQLAFKDLFESDVQVFEARKNVAKLCVTRTDLFTTAYGQARNIWIFAVGQQNESDYPEVAQASPLLKRMKAGLIKLAQVNKDMMTAMDSLDVESRRRLFEKRVRIFDAKASVSGRTFVNMTTFQAVEKIIETGLRGIDLGTNNLEDVIPDFQIILINAMNDLLYEAEILARFLNNVAANQREVILQTNSDLLIKCLCILILLFVAFAVAIAKQYKAETQNMSAAARIDAGGIVQIKDRVVEFQAMLQDETCFFELGNSGLLSAANEIVSNNLPIQNLKGKFSTVHAEQPLFKGIIRKYQQYSLIFFALWAIVGGIVIWKYFNTASSTDNLKYVLDQIYFSDRSRPRTRLFTLLTVEFVSDNTALVRNLNLPKQWNLETYFLKNVTHNITSLLQKQDSTAYDPIIEDILFEDACKYTPNDDYIIEQCKIMQADSSNAGLVRFLSKHQTTLSDFMAAYQRSDKSPESLAALNLATYDDRIPPMKVIVDLMEVISAQLDISFSDAIDDTKSFSILGSTILYIGLVVICVLIQIFVFNKILEAENEFRNVLKVFPARLVLTNFMLKSYLIRTWKGTLDSAKLLSRD